MTATLSPRPLTEELEPARAGWITEWRPEDDDFWATTGRRVARRNLIFSIFAEHLGFSVWVLWSVLVVVLGTHPNDFPFLNPKVTANADKIFWLVALPNLIGALMRLPYTVAVLRFGGRNWTVVSALLLLILYNAAMVAAPLFWLPLVLAAAVCAYLFMNNLHVSRTPVREQLAVTREPQAWVMSFLYIGTFGSFLGLAAAFPAVLAFEFPKDQKFYLLGTALLLPVAFLGPLVGSLARPIGGWLSDRVGGAKVTAAVFALMAVVTLGAIRAADAKSLSLFLTTMLVLFTLAGFGNGSTYKMIPAIFKRQAMLAGRDDTAGFTRAVRLGSTTLGMAGAIGALGGFYMPRAIGNSIKATGGITQAFTIFFVMYVVCLLVTALCYLRPGARLRGV